MVYRIALSVAFLFIFAGLLSTTAVQSADLNEPTQTGTITVIKNVIKNDGGNAAPDEFQLTIGGSPAISGVAKVLPANTDYAINETQLPGYTFISITGDPKCPASLGGTITLTEGDNITCTIANDDIAPQLTLIKDPTNNNGGNAAPNDFKLTVGGLPATSGVAKVLVANTAYAINETQLSGYTFVSITGNPKCPASLGETITLDEGDNITCTITNDDIAPSLTVIKDPTNDNSLTAAPDDFNITVGGAPVSSGVSETYLANTLLDINEAQITGYKFVSITGHTKCPTTLGGSITLDEGDDITCTITNNDVGFNFTPPDGLLTSESGLPTDSFEVTLDTMPIAPVTLELHSSNTDEGIIDKPSLTFTDTTWNIPQTVTITGVDDPVPVADGDVGYSIITGPVTTTDPDYGALDPVLHIPDVSVINSDNDTAGISTSPNTDLWTSEGGASETIQVLLQTKPSHPVLLNIVSDNGEGTVSPSSLTINPEPWPPTTPKEFTITGVDDCKSGGDNYEVTITASSDDPVYNGRKEVLNLTNYDAPTIGWVDPVGDEQFYDVEGLGPIQLKVKSLCPEPISKVRFYRWVVSIGDNVNIGEDLTSPYTEVLDPAEIELGVNQVRAFAFGPPVENQTFSIHKRIFIVKDLKHYILLPLISKRP
jgi:antitoxin component of MazEF toxin-antitoxin module